MSDNKKELTYDEEIYPLMLQIIEICKRSGINLAASFSLTEDQDDPLFCTTIIPGDKDDSIGIQRNNEAAKIFYPRPAFAAFTITTIK